MRDVDGGVNDAEVQAYFPLDHVRDTIFRMYARQCSRAWCVR